MALGSRDRRFSSRDKRPKENGPHTRAGLWETEDVRKALACSGHGFFANKKGEKRLYYTLAPSPRLFLMPFSLWPPT